MRSRLARRVAVATLLLGACLALAATVAIQKRTALAHWWTLRQLAARGIAPASVEVARFDAGRLELRGLRAGAQDQLRVDAIDADYTLSLLWQGRIGALRISGVRLTGEIGPDGARFGGLESAGGGDGTGAPGAQAGLRLPALPSSQLVIDDARAEIKTRQGLLAAVLSVDAKQEGGRISARGDLVAEHPLAKATAKLDLAGAGDQVEGGAAIGLEMAPGADLGLPLSAGRLALAARIELAGSDLTASLSPGYLALAFGEGKDALRVEGTTPKAALRSKFEDGELAPIELATSGGKLSSPSLGFSARGFQLEGKLEPPWRFEGKLGVRELKDTRKPRRLPPVLLEGRLEPRKDDLAFDLIAAESKRRVVWHAKGAFDPETGSADAELKMDTVVFASGGLQPTELAPQLDGFVRSATGALEATGRARYAKGKPRIELELAARDLTLETSNAHVEGVNGTVRIEGPGPFSTPPGQLISIGLIRAGLVLTNGLVGGQLRPDGVIAIEKAEWQTLGGRVFTSGDLDPDAEHQALVLEAEDLDLAQLFGLIDLEGLAGDGRLDGKLPIDRSAKAILIRGGVLRARPGARIRYLPPAGVKALEKSQQGIELLLGAFENLEVETLELTLDGDANGVMKLVLRLVGVNPQFQEGRPLHYTLSLESRLADLLRQGVAAYRIPQQIEERLQHFEQEKKQ
jgi:hypothetical protein